MPQGDTPGIFPTQPPPSTPLSDRSEGSASSLGTLIIVFAGGNLVSFALRMISGLLVARWTSPELMGLFNGLGLVLTYAPLLYLGLPDGMNRELPFYFGRNDTLKARSLAATTQAWVLFVNIFVSAILLAISGFYASKQDWLLAVGWGTQAFSAFVLFYGQFYIEMTFRTHSNFAQISTANVIQNIIGLLSAFFALLFGFFGLCVRSVLMGSTYLGLMWHWRPIRVKPNWDWNNFKHLYKVGMPIYVVRQLNTWWMALISTLILLTMGTHSLGIYQVAFLTNTAIILLTNSVSQVVYPRMVETFSKGSSLSHVLRVSRKPVIICMVLAVPTVVLGWLAMPYIVGILLPRYSEGTVAAQWMLMIVFPLCLNPVIIAFNVIKRQDLYAFTTLLGMVFNYAWLFWMSHDGFVLVYFIQAYVLGKLISACSACLILFYLSRVQLLSDKNFPA